MSMKGLTVLVLALATLAACRPDDQRTDTIDPVEAQMERENLPPEVVAHLDSGSAAFRADDHEQALAHYTRASELGPDVAAAWFGVYMAQRALGNDEAAATALEKAQQKVPGATLIHPSAADTAR